MNAPSVPARGCSVLRLGDSSTTGLTSESSSNSSMRRRSGPRPRRASARCSSGAAVLRLVEQQIVGAQLFQLGLERAASRESGARAAARRGATFDAALLQLAQLLGQQALFQLARRSSARRVAARSTGAPIVLPWLPGDGTCAMPMPSSAACSYGNSVRT